MAATQTDTAIGTDSHTDQDVLDVLIIGGGFSGLSAEGRLRTHQPRSVTSLHLCGGV